MSFIENGRQWTVREYVPEGVEKGSEQDFDGLCA
jgi:hypothetical protein